MSLGPLTSERLKAKLAVLADAAKYDASCASSGSRRGGAPGALGATNGMGICHSYTPDGRCVSLLKILLTNACRYDCLYCVNRVTSDVPRAAFSPPEVIALTMEFYRRNYIEGLFLSSGIPQSPDATLEDLVAVARGLRQQHGFRGYVHLKVPPGASAALIAQAGRFADRLSANIELPTQSDLDRFAADKRIDDVEASMGIIRDGADEAREAGAPTFAPAGQSTQLVVGASDSPDAVILASATRLYRRHRLRRVYYTAFSPFPNADARLPVRPAPLVREHRLYEADWLVRHYGFAADELTTPEAPNLPLDLDPKLAWALRHRDRFPVDLNRADREVILRVPGIGVRAAERLLAIRRQRAIRLEDLARLRVAVRRARAFVVTADHNPALRGLDGVALADRVRPPSRQLSLFDAARGARGGEL
jgi:putative DNA modification/repair radical SAM protein